MKATRWGVALVLGLAGLMPAANAQPVYRCGNEYTHAPCASARVVEAADGRSGAQLAEARRLAADGRRRADALERERRRDEAAIRPAQASSLSAPAPASAASAAKATLPKKRHHKSQPSGNRDFIAAVPGSAKPD